MAITSFPPVSCADENGLLAVGGDLEVSSLILAYSNGIFPWPISPEFPLAWFSPDPRGILNFNDLHISRSMKKLIKKNLFEIRFNHDFEAVIKNCAMANNRKEGPGTWITDEIISAYRQLFKQGFAYSAETWQDGELVGGLYGVCLGGIVSGESMFYKVSNASKFALIKLMEFLNSRGISWLDTQMTTGVIRDLGGREIPRSDFIKKIEKKESFAIKNQVFNSKLIFS